MNTKNLTDNIIIAAQSRDIVFEKGEDGWYWFHKEDENMEDALMGPFLSKYWAAKGYFSSGDYLLSDPE